MKIVVEIDCPSVLCVRCGIESIVAPVVLRREDQRQHVFIGSAAVRALEGFAGVDIDSNAKWQALDARPPEGWNECPLGKVCPRCYAAWQELGSAFMKGNLTDDMEQLPLNRELPPAPVEEVPVTPEHSRHIYPDQRASIEHRVPHEPARVSVAPNIIAPQRTMVTPNSVPIARHQNQVEGPRIMATAQSVSPIPTRASHEQLTQAAPVAQKSMVSSIPMRAPAEQLTPPAPVAQQSTVSTIPIPAPTPQKN